ncbi:substrate-binding domain-containing protein, partial [Serratia marcescens]|uniref:substrate-binding domain-containing protein n=1 Tax=Serratia marcescens TaxID=615 RepID=UPI001EF78009
CGTSSIALAMGSVSFLSPPLTCIDIPINKLGMMATNLLFRLIHQDKNVPKTTIIQTEMILE